MLLLCICLFRNIEFDPSAARKTYEGHCPNTTRPERVKGAEGFGGRRGCPFVTDDCR